MSGRKSTLEHQFWKHVVPEPNSGCWLWSGSTDRKGYGQLRVFIAPGLSRLTGATHVSLRLVGREVLPGMLACHHCDNPPCVNPDHLFIGTPMTNTHDAMSKGRLKPPPIKQPGRTRRPEGMCLNGHVLINGYLRPDGVMACRECMRENKRQLRAKRVAAGLTTRGLPRIAGYV